MLLGAMLDRVTLSARTLAYAAIAIMVMTPESATGPSFQMSFAAVAASGRVLRDVAAAPLGLACRQPERGAASRSIYSASR